MEILTALQWAKKGFIPNEGAKGTKQWTNSFYSAKAVYFKDSEVHEAGRAGVSCICLFFISEAIENIDEYNLYHLFYKLVRMDYSKDVKRKE